MEAIGGINHYWSGIDEEKRANARVTIPIKKKWLRLVQARQLTNERLIFGTGIIIIVA